MHVFCVFIFLMLGEMLNVTDAYAHRSFFSGIDEMTGFKTRYICHHHHHHQKKKIYSAHITVIGHRCITQSLTSSTDIKCQTEKLCFKLFLNVLGSVIAWKYSGTRRCARQILCIAVAPPAHLRGILYLSTFMLSLIPDDKDHMCL